MTWALDTASLVSASVAAREAGALRDAIDLAEDAIRSDAGSAEAWTAAGLALAAARRPGEAGAALRRAAFLAPSCPVTQNALGLLLQDSGQLADAAHAFERAIHAEPRWWVPYLNAGLLHLRQSRPEAALPRFRAAVRLAPDEARAWNALGTALLLLRDLPGAEEALRTALRLRPDDADSLSNLGRTLRAAGRMAEARDAYASALALRPDHAETRWNAGILALLQGDFAAGWEGIEARWQLPRFPSRPRGFTQPLWSGEDIAGRRILLHAEQGFGDSIQLLRYVPVVAARGAEVVLELQPELLALAEASGLPATLVATGRPLPQFDVHCPLLSLPRAFGTRADSVPSSIPYLCPPAVARTRWRERLPKDGGPPRLGLVWAGRPTHANDANRSVGLAALAPVLSDVPWRCVSLQVGAAAGEIGALGLADRIEDLSPLLGDFAETAAALERIDLLVSVDTAVAHLAGALGTPVVLLLPFAPDWRWMLGRDDTPWYPSMRLLRQHAPGDWSAPLAALAEALRSPLLQAAE